MCSGAGTNFENIIQICNKHEVVIMIHNKKNCGAVERAEKFDVPHCYVNSKDEDTMAMMNKQMTYFMPVVIVVIGVTLPSGLSLYWLISTLFMVAQQYIAFRGGKDGETKIDEKTTVIAK